MTGGACAGFAAATGSPMTGILFAFEEAHRRFSPMIFMVSAMTVASGAVTTRILYHLVGEDWDLFRLSVEAALPLRALWAPALVGFLCGIVSVIFTKCYGLCNRLLTKTKKLPLIAVVVSVFAAISVVGFFSHDSVGSGHHLIESLFSADRVSYTLIFVLILRVLFLIVANNAGITGGAVVPSLAFGAILGGLCGKGMILAGWLGEEYYPVLVVVGMASFLGASSKTPLLAVVFALEALCGISNVLPIVLGVSLSYLVIEIFGIPAFTETVLHHKAVSAREGRPATTEDRKMTVRSGSFVIGKEVRDILWPPSCVVLSVDRNPAIARGGGELREGDVLHLHYTTYDSAETAKDLVALVGKQRGE